MKEKYTNEEILLRLLLEKLENSKTNSILLYKGDIDNCSLDEKEVVFALHVLHTDGHILIKKMSPQNNLSMPCRIEITSTGIHYFEIKKRHKTENRRMWVSVYVIAILTFLNLIKEWLNEVLQLLTSSMR